MSVSSAAMATASLRGALRDPDAWVGLVAVALWVGLALDGGGFSATSFGLLGAIFVVAAAVAFAAAPATELGRPRVVALAALAGFVVWSALSALWAAFPGEAWISADKTLLYAVGLAVLLVRPWSRDARVLVLAAFAFGIGGVAISSLAELARAAVPAALLTDGRLDGSVEYVNASVALWMLASGRLPGLPALVAWRCPFAPQRSGRRSSWSRSRSSARAAAGSTCFRSRSRSSCC